ncbi:ABC transporter permease [Mucilaginibacter ginsenosidivorans]|uniref:ABC transporter permease n=1 Tax=Mucilaginibacter ginsenosidivorans TaxID=398053 RepID=A0A5B8V4G8_9SPHI|nr:ABC transporter permease [Mucilaginibacter ginsenosidivorans]
MNTAIYIARRYLFSRKKMHAINIISGISMLGVFIGSAALIVILSVFNGFEKVILSLYSNFTPEMLITPKQGKTFDPNTPYFNALRRDPKLISFTEILEEKALIRYGTDGEFIGTVRGVSDDFLKDTLLDSTIVKGSFTLKSKGHFYAVIGATVQSKLSVNINDQLSPLQIYTPNRHASSSADQLNEFEVRYIYPSGIFNIQQDFNNLIITHIDFMRDLLNEPKNISAIALNYKKGTDLKLIKDDLSDKLSTMFTIKDRYEQNAELYKTLNYERWFIFVILTFVLVIAIFNIIGSLTMLVIDKQKDIAILTSLGANSRLIQGIFFSEGMMISFIGCIAGMLVGLIFCLLQEQFGFIRFGEEMSAIDAYPVALKVTDFLLVFLTVGGISTIASGISARLSIKRLGEIKEEL